MKTNFRTLTCQISLFLFAIFASGQDVEEQFNNLSSRLKNDPLQVTGNFSAFSQWYQAYGIDQRALPFNGRVMAALNLDFLGIKAPFSLAYSNGGLVFNKRLPSYSFVGISPSYKWAKLLIGTRTMDFGRYSFSNHAFTGGGFELTPGNWTASAFYGRLRRARIEDFQGINNVDPFFKRMGFGGKFGYQAGKDKVLLSIFKAWDDGSSIPLLDTTLNVFPSENVIISGELGKRIRPGVDLEIHFANSGFTEDRRTNLESRNYSLSNYIGLLNDNSSTRTNNAIEAKVNFKLGKVATNIAYERIDPGYRTMGALFFNNDLENISAGAKLKLLKKKWIINLRGGLQRNNLGGDQANNYRRLVGSLNTVLNVNKKLAFTASYSNFNNVNRRRSFANIDTLVVISDLVLSNVNAMIGANFVLSNDNSRSSGLQASLSFTEGNTIENDLIAKELAVNSAHVFLNYYLQLKPSKWTFGANGSRQRNTQFGSTINFSNVGLSASKVLMKDRMNLSINSNYTLTSQLLDLGSLNEGRIISSRFVISYSVSDNANIVFTSAYLHNHVNQEIGSARRFSEFRNGLQFQYQFKPKKR